MTPNPLENLNNYELPDILSHKEATGRLSETFIDSFRSIFQIPSRESGVTPVVSNVAAAAAI